MSAPDVERIAANKYIVGAMSNGKACVFLIEKLMGGAGFIGRNVTPNPGVIAKSGYVPWSATEGEHLGLEDATARLAEVAAMIERQIGGK